MNSPDPHRLIVVGCLNVVVMVSAIDGAWAGSWSGFAEIEGRAFPRDVLDPAQSGSGFSLALQPEYVRDWDDGKQRLTVVPFVRLDQRDHERTHADLRELEWLLVGEGYEWRVGIRKVFWGVTESQHLVDIINQTDLVENVDGEDKLGQPMSNLALIREWGTFDLFVLPGFRERTFPGPEGRLRTIPLVDTDLAQFESERGRGRTDLAVRWAHAVGPIDVGLSHFYGTGRDPTLRPGLNDAGDAVLIPRYEIINQTGLDVQLTLNRWLWKLEAINRAGQGRRYVAATGGVEFTVSRLFGSDVDLGWIAESLYDQRGDDAPVPFQDDVMVGWRLTFNDPQSTDTLVGIIADRTTSARVVSAEGSRRLGDRWKVVIEARAFVGIPDASVLTGSRNDDYVQVAIIRYF